MSFQALKPCILGIWWGRHFTLIESIHKHLKASLNIWEELKKIKQKDTHISHYHTSELSQTKGKSQDLCPVRWDEYVNSVSHGILGSSSGRIKDPQGRIDEVGEWSLRVPWLHVPNISSQLWETYKTLWDVNTRRNGNDFSRNLQLVSHKTFILKKIKCDEKPCIDCLFSGKKNCFPYLVWIGQD